MECGVGMRVFTGKNVWREERERRVCRVWGKCSVHYVCVSVLLTLGW